APASWIAQDRAVADPQRQRPAKREANVPVPEWPDVHVLGDRSDMQHQLLLTARQPDALARRDRPADGCLRAGGCVQAGGWVEYDVRAGGPVPRVRRHQDAVALEGAGGLAAEV